MHEVGQDNHGQFVNRVQRSTVTKPYGEPWCMDFVHFCVDQVNSVIKVLSGKSWDLLLRSESCMNVYKHYQRGKHKVYLLPAEGRVVIWNRGGGEGHCGIVSAAEEGEEHFYSIEGNTSGRLSPSQETLGEGVYAKFRHIERPPAEGWKLMGFIDPWDGFECQFQSK